MAGRWLRKRKILGVALVVLLAGAGLAWVERHDLLAWYCLRGLCRASEADRDRWVERVVCLGEPVVPGLLDALAAPCPHACGNIRVALARLGEAWGPADPRSAS